VRNFRRDGSKAQRRPILGQLEGQWEKVAALLVWKLAREKGVTITFKDMEQCHADGLVFMTWGHFDSIDFKMITPEAAKRLADHQETQKGTA
jgi:hypothetical protein